MGEGIESLEWDSAFFGLRVGRLEGSGEVLVDLLRDAGGAAPDLLYWQAGQLPDLSSLAGVGYELGHSDWRVTYARPIDELRELGSLDVAAEPAVAEWPGGPASDALLGLAALAGAHSRFRLDPRIPNERFVTLYRTWLARSASGEMADTLQVSMRDGDPLGFATGRLEDELGDVTLMAVAERARGGGLGWALMAAVIRALGSRGARVASLVTQRDNVVAREIYERRGLRVQSETCIHHLWRRE